MFRMHCYLHFAECFSDVLPVRKHYIMRLSARTRGNKVTFIVVDRQPPMKVSCANMPPVKGVQDVALKKKKKKPVCWSTCDNGDISDVFYSVQ